MESKTLLNVGSGGNGIALPAQYDLFKKLSLDIDATARPDIVGDARDLLSRPAGEFDAIYCSHALEHFYRHDVPKVLRGFFHVLRAGGFCHLRVPDLSALMRAVIDRRIALDEKLYVSELGPVHPLDVIFGLGSEIERSGKDFYAHKTGFDGKSLVAALQRAGFRYVFNWTLPETFDLNAIAFKNELNPGVLASFGIKL